VPLRGPNCQPSLPEVLAWVSLPTVRCPARAQEQIPYISQSALAVHGQPQSALDVPFHIQGPDRARCFTETWPGRSRAPDPRASDVLSEDALRRAREDFDAVVARGRLEEPGGAHQV
jgi:hypothetical protein